MNKIEFIRQVIDGDPAKVKLVGVQIDGQRFWLEGSEQNLAAAACKKILEEEVLEIYEVAPLYRGKISDPQGGNFLGLNILGMPKTRFRPGMKIRVSVVGRG